MTGQRQSKVQQVLTLCCAILKWWNNCAMHGKGENVCVHLVLASLLQKAAMIFQWLRRMGFILLFRHNCGGAKRFHHCSLHRWKGWGYTTTIQCVLWFHCWSGLWYIKNCEGGIQVQSWPYCACYFMTLKKFCGLIFCCCHWKYQIAIIIAHRPNSVGTDSTTTFHTGLSLLCWA